MPWVDRTNAQIQQDPWKGYYYFWASYVALVQSLIGLAIIFGPDRWLHFNSAGVIHAHSEFIPWVVFGIVFIFSGVGVLNRYTRRAAYSTAFLINAFFSVAAALYTLLAPSRFPPGSTAAVNTHPNPITIAMALYAPLVMIAGVRYVLMSIKGSQSG